jgi:hypothetical protein
MVVFHMPEYTFRSDKDLAHVNFFYFSIWKHSRSPAGQFHIIVVVSQQSAVFAETPAAAAAAATRTEAATTNGFAQEKGQHGTKVSLINSLIFSLTNVFSIL